MKRTTSMRQIEANRKNARKSTGPKTEHGKTCSRLNALKRGMLAREVVLRGLHDGEQEREFHAVYRRYWDYYGPEGPLEEMLVERIATTYWRLHRVIIAERGEITRTVDGTHRGSNEMSPAQFQMALVTGHIESSALGVAYVQHILEGVRASVQRDQELTEEAEQRVAKAFMGEPNSISIGLREAREGARGNAEGLDGEAVRAKEREAVLSFVEKELERCKTRSVLMAEREESETEAREAAAFLPEPAVVEKIMRYEGSLERQLYRAINQLERLQRLRRGDQVPPPLVVQVSQ